jgi:hypothetical protein
MAKNQMPPSVPLQEFQFRQQKSVQEAVIKAKGIRGKLGAGAKAAFDQKLSSMYSDTTTGGAKALRFFGFDRTAKFWDMMRLNEEKIEALEEKKLRKAEDAYDKALLKKGANAEKVARERQKERDARMATRQKAYDKYFGDGTAKTKPSGVVKVSTGSASYDVRVITTIARDVKHIKALLMPKQFNVKMGKQAGKQAVQYNPLAPDGQKYQLVNDKGRVTGAAGKRIEERAAKTAAQLTANYILKIQKQDQKKETYKWQDKTEGFQEENPLIVINERLARIEEKLDGKEKKKGWLGTLGLMLAGMWNKLKKILSPMWTIVKGIWTFFKPILKFTWTIVKGMWKLVRPVLTAVWNIVKGIAQAAARLVGKWFPGLSIPGLVAGGAAVATTGAMAYALDTGMKQVADKSIDAITSDVTKNQERAGFKAEDSYAAYKMAIDNALASPMNKSQERQDYIKQQLTSSEGLTDTERRMAARYFHEKEGGSSTGPTSRGGPRGVASTTPPPPPSSQVEEVVVSAPKSQSQPQATGTLNASTYESRLAQLAEVIASGESRGDYNIFNKGTIGKNAGKVAREDLSKMTITEYLRRGSLGKDDPQKMFAVGKYQIIPDTMRNIVKGLGLDPNTTTLTPEVQDRMFRYLVDGKPAVRKYLEGKSDDANAAILALSKEWASVGVPVDTMRNGKLIKAGESYYSGEGGNKAHTSPTAVMAALQPVPGVSGSMVDSQSRALTAANQPAPAVTVVGGPTVNQTTVNTMNKRPVPRADVLSNDNALTRTVMRDTQHPVTVG